MATSTTPRSESSSRPQKPRRVSHAERIYRPADPRKFNYDLDFSVEDFREHPELYRVGIGEQGVLLVEPYKSEILPLWRFRTPEIAAESARLIYSRFLRYKAKGEFVGMDMCRKFLQMGYTRSRRYANHASGKKYDADGKVLPRVEDHVKAHSAEIFKRMWERVERDGEYKRLKARHKATYG